MPNTIRVFANILADVVAVTKKGADLLLDVVVVNCLLLTRQEFEPYRARLDI